MNTRRNFIHRTATAGALAGLSDLGILGGLSPVQAEETQPNPDAAALM